MAAATIAGLLGKLPARGDFITLGLPGRFVAPWRDRVDGLVLASRDLLGVAWMEAFMVGPVWQFCLSPGVCGPDGALGLMMPSVDRVGRAYPLTLGAVLSDEVAASDGAASTGADDWLDWCEDWGRSALAEDLDPDLVAQRLGEAPPPTRIVWSRAR